MKLTKKPCNTHFTMVAWVDYYSTDTALGKVPYRPPRTMNDIKGNKKYIVTKGPVNSRTAATRSPRDVPAAPAVVARIKMARARHLLGTPLAARLETPRHGVAHRDHPRAALILQAIGAAVAGTGLLLGLIQQSLPTLAFSALALAGLGAWVFVDARHRRRQIGSEPWKTGQLVDASDIEHLDSAMEKIAAQSPQETLDRLAQLKESITRCVHLMGSTPAGEGFSSEDHLYIRECIRRYVPDTIHSCLKIPQKDRSTLVIDGSKPGLDLLHDQIDMIQAELHLRESRLTQLAGESLVRQHNFLSAKSSRRT